jgi:16S rRNA (adenine1518-N6/adenine1519-N6)-dimethyltransferase
VVTSGGRRRASQGEGSERVLGPEEAGATGFLRRLRAAGVPPRKSLGQHYLHDPKLLSFLVEAAEIGPRDAVLEIGTGPGALTRHLARAAGRVLTVEVDPRLVAFARRELEPFPHVEILEADALGRGRGLNPVIEAKLRSLGPFRWVSNLPYSIATPLILALLEAELPWERAVVTVQREVAERLTASPGQRAYGPTSLLVAFWAHGRVLRRIRAGSFSPAPKVESAVLSLEPLAQLPDVKLYGPFRAWVRILFGQRRKQLGAVLRHSERHGDLDLEGKPRAEAILAVLKLDPRSRVEALGLEDFLVLAKEFPL